MWYIGLSIFALLLSALAAQGASFLPGMSTSVIVPADPTVGLLPAARSDYASWSTAGLQAVPFTASIATDGTMSVSATDPDAQVLGIGQTITGAGVASGTTIIALGTGTGGNGTYTVSPSPASTVSSEAMTANGIPNRQVIYTTLSACSPTLTTSCDDTATITNALSACPANQVVKLNAGVFQVQNSTFQSVEHQRSRCTLRGAGPGRQLSVGLNLVGQGTQGTAKGTIASVATACTAAGGSIKAYGDMSFCMDSTATQLVKTDRATSPYPVMAMGYLPTPLCGSSVSLTADASKGDRTITLASIPAGLVAGSLVIVDEDTFHNGGDPDVFWGTDFVSNGAPSYAWFTACGGSRGYRSISQVMEVQSVNSSAKTVTFTTTLHHGVTVALAAQLTPYNGFVTGAGIEDLMLAGGWGGDCCGNLLIAGCAYCWVKNVEGLYSGGGNIHLEGTFKTVVREAFTHESLNPNPGGDGYQFSINGGAADNLVEDNIFWNGNKEIVIRGGGGGNVIAYNYMDDAFGGGYPDLGEAGLNAGHYTTTHMELEEGNYSQNFKGDAFWGNSIYIVVYRNWLSMLRASSVPPNVGYPPLNTYSISNCGGTQVYRDIDNRRGVDLQQYSNFHSIIGNVIGTPGQTLLSGDSCVGSQTTWTEQVYTSANSGANPTVWIFGEHQDDGTSGGCGTCFVNGAMAAMQVIRTANYDYVTNQEKCFDKTPWTTVSNTTDQGCSGIPTLPPSFYLTSKPSFFGSHPWPWVDPATHSMTVAGDGTTAYSGVTGSSNILPAKWCFENHHMPGCTLP